MKAQAPSCRYCGEVLRGAFLFEGCWAPSLLCPQLHHGFVYEPSYGADLKLSYKELDCGGQTMAIPEEFIRWR